MKLSFVTALLALSFSQLTLAETITCTGDSGPRGPYAGLAGNLELKINQESTGEAFDRISRQGIISIQYNQDPSYKIKSEDELKINNYLSNLNGKTMRVTTTETGEGMETFIKLEDRKVALSILHSGASTLIIDKVGYVLSIYCDGHRIGKLRGY